MVYTALYREWRPQKFSEIVGQEHISRTLRNAIKSGRIAHAYLFCGPRGTGKTTTAKVLAKALNCLNGTEAEPCNSCENCKKVTEGISMDVMEIDAASNRGIDEIRDLREKVKFAPTEGKYRIYIIDEVHMLTTEAFNALLKTLEEPPSHVIFVLATTEPHKIPLTILSRCQRFDFRRIGLNDIIGRLRAVVDQLGIVTDDEVLGLIAKTAEGGMRDALSVLDQCISFGGNQISIEDVNAVLGTVNSEILFKMVAFFAESEVTGALKLVDELVKQGKDVRQFAKDLTEYFRNLLLANVCENVEEILPVSIEAINNMKEQSLLLGKDRIISLIELFTSTEKEIKWSSQPRLVLELAVIKAGDKAYDNSYSELLAKVAQLEETLARIQAAPANLAVISSSKSGSSDVQKATESKKPSSKPPAKTPSKPSLPVAGGDEQIAVSVDCETVKKCWQDILDRIKKVRVSARAFLLECEPVEVHQGKLVLAFPDGYGFHKDKVEQPENKKAIEQVVREVTGSDLKLHCRFVSDVLPQPEVEDDIQESSLIEKARSMFDGDIIEIID